MKDDTKAPPEARLMQALFGFMVTKGVSAMAAYGVADALKDGPLYYTDLAARTGCDQRALHRVMRMLSGVGLFEEPEPGRYALNEVSHLLRGDVPGSLRDMAMMITSQSHWLPWGRLEETLRSGRSGPQHAFGTDIFSWFQQEGNEEQWRLFNAAMTSFSSGIAHAVTAGYDFGGFRHVVDVGGGHGYFLKTLLEKAPEARGTLFDMPQVVESADADTLGTRIAREGGDFFQSVPAGGDCYTMKHVLHDWSDEQCVTILKNVVAAMQPDGKVLVAETVMPESPDAHPAKFMDVNMLAMTEGGCERTEAEFAELFGRAGLKLVAVHPTPSPVSVVEGVRA